MPLRAFIAALVFVVALAPARAADTLAYSESFDTLFRVDLTAHTATKVGQATPVGVTRFANIEGLTLTPGGTLYGVSDGNPTKTLLRIDPTTGLATVVGTLVLTGGDTTGQLDLGMAATCDGKLWLSSGTGLFWQIDPNTAAATFVGNVGAKVTGLAAHDQHGDRRSHTRWGLRHLDLHHHIEPSLRCERTFVDGARLRSATTRPNSVSGMERLGADKSRHRCAHRHRSDHGRCGIPRRLLRQPERTRHQLVVHRGRRGDLAVADVVLARTRRVDGPPGWFCGGPVQPTLSPVLIRSVFDWIDSVT